MARSAPLSRVPAYRLHSPSGQAVVSLCGRDVYLGVHGSAASRSAYDRAVAEWLARGRSAPPAAEGGELLVAELLLAYWRDAERQYRKRGRPTGQAAIVRRALRSVRQLYGSEPASAFGPLALRAVRARLVAEGLCRKTVNKYVGAIRCAWRWAVVEELLPASAHQALRAVPDLRRGREDLHGAPESPPVVPPSRELLRRCRPHMGPRVRAMVLLQRLTGMRPGEVVQLRGCDLRFAAGGRCWYEPAAWKTEHVDGGDDARRRRVELGPRALRVLRPFLAGDPAAPLFSPAAEWRQWAARRSDLRVTRRWRSHDPAVRRLRRRRPPRVFGACYTVGSYRRAVQRACEAAFPPPERLAHRRGEHPRAWRARLLAAGLWAELLAWRRGHRWHPNQLRHEYGTRVREEFGVEAAQVALGHRHLRATEIYAEPPRRLARRIAERLG